MDDEAAHAPVPSSVTSSDALVIPFPSRPKGEGYRSGGFNLPAVLLIVVIHAVLLTALIQMRTVIVKKADAMLAVVNLSPPAPPPPSEEPPPPPSRPEVVMPPPIVRTPIAPVQPVAVVEEVAPRPLAAPTSAPPAPPALPPGPPATIQGRDLATRMISGKPPRYPLESRRKREQGTVVLSLILGTDGRVASISLAQSSGFPRLDEAARDAVRTWRWEPTIRNGEPVQVKGLVEIPFILQG